MKKSNNYIWMPLIGFDREQADKGVSEYLNKAGFVPEGISVFIFHPDIVNQHEGMEREYQLSADCCSYFGSPRNEFRDRQDWTNYDLRTLAHELADKGIDAYLGIDGVYLNNTRHYEWETDYPELFSFGKNGRMNLNVLKRFKDGTYYEDFFLEKCIAAIEDYGFAGLHVADFFCPPEHSICNGDFSADLLDQFKSHSGVEYPDYIAERLAFDEQSDIDARADYIWGNLRREWIEFYVWRWCSFWGKIATALHARGKKVMINNAWASDPFEALYRYGIDYKKLYAVGVDRFVAETVCDGIELLDGVGDKYRQYMTMAQLMRAYAPEGGLHTLLGVKDCTEEWDMLHHEPIRLERAMYTLGSIFLGGKKMSHSTDGYMVTLGDGITEDEWKWIRERSEIAFADVPERILAPTVIWSDAAHEAMLGEYLENRRPSLHKIMYELENKNAAFGAAARVEELSSLEGAIVVPNFDLLSESEQKAVLEYKGGAVVAIAPRGYAAKRGIKADCVIVDTAASYALEAFAIGMPEGYSPEVHPCEISDCESDGDVKTWQDASFFLSPMLFRSISEGFLESTAALIRAAGLSLFKSDAYILPMLLDNGKYRVYVFNSENLYKRIKVHTARGIKSVNAVSKYPIMPVKFAFPEKENNGPKLDGAKAESIRIGEKVDEIPYCFVGKVPPEGVSIFDVELYES